MPSPSIGYQQHWAENPEAFEEMFQSAIDTGDFPRWMNDPKDTDWPDKYIYEFLDEMARDNKRFSQEKTSMKRQSGEDFNVKKQLNKFDSRIDYALRDGDEELASYYQYLRDEFQRDLKKGRGRPFSWYEPAVEEEFGRVAPSQ